MTGCFHTVELQASSLHGLIRKKAPYAANILQGISLSTYAGTYFWTMITQGIKVLYLGTLVKCLKENSMNIPNTAKWAIKKISSHLEWLQSPSEMQKIFTDLQSGGQRQ